MKYITNDECLSILNHASNIDGIRRAYTTCNTRCKDVVHVFFENGKHTPLEKPLIPKCGRIHSFCLCIAYEDGSIQRHVLHFNTLCQYAYGQAYLLIEQLRLVTDELVSVEYGMAKDWHWTAETIWDKENGYYYDLQTYNGLLADIRESYWAKPVLLFTYIDKDGVESEKWVYCYREVDAIGLERLVAEDANDLN